MRMIDYHSSIGVDFFLRKKYYQDQFENNTLKTLI